MLWACLLFGVGRYGVCSILLRVASNWFVLQVWVWRYCCWMVHSGQVGEGRGVGGGGAVLVSISVKGRVLLVLQGLGARIVAGSVPLVVSVFG